MTTDLRQLAELACVLPWEKPGDVPWRAMWDFQMACKPEQVVELLDAAEELAFYRTWGHPFTDHSTMFDDDHEGLYAINLPISLPRPESEGTVTLRVVRAFTSEALYAKAKAHIAALQAEGAALDARGK